MTRVGDESIDWFYDEEKDHTADDYERNHHIDKMPISEDAVFHSEGEGREIRLAGNGGNKRCQQILDKGSNHGSKCGTDDYPYGQIDDASSQQELPELFQSAHFNLLSLTNPAAHLITTIWLKAQPALPSPVRHS